MPAGNNSTVAKLGSRLRELGVVLPLPASPLGAYVETSQVGSLLFLSGTLPLVNRKLAISGRLGANLSIEQGQEAARLAALNALAAAQEHVGDLDRLKKLVKLSVLLSTTEEFVDHAAVADGASNLFVQLFGAQAGHVRVAYGVYSAPVGTPVMVETVFEIESPQREAQEEPMSECNETESGRQLDISYPKKLTIKKGTYHDPNQKSIRRMDV
jgi:enamine deaminase RidA (YjgF/YER057c/UK114 family)